MTFCEVLEQVVALLQRHGRMSYRPLKRQFQLDDAYLKDLKAELVEVQQVAVDQDGIMLVWTGDAPVALPPAAPVRAREQAPRTYTLAHLAEKILATQAALEGERKQVTVLFADLKGSTELIAGLDPEAARRLLDPALHTMIEAVHRYEGTVNQVLGDCIMALFGAPIAHEDHAVRACYAALAMQAAMQCYAEEVRRTQGLAVQMRVGLNSGEVVVRDVGNDLHVDYSAVGQTTHLAARIEQLAAPRMSRAPRAGRQHLPECTGPRAGAAPRGSRWGWIRPAGRGRLSSTLFVSGQPWYPPPPKEDTHGRAGQASGGAGVARAFARVPGAVSAAGRPGSAGALDDGAAHRAAHQVWCYPRPSRAGDEGAAVAGVPHHQAVGRGGPQPPPGALGS